MIGILGAGAFGTALGVALTQGGASARIWARDPLGIENGESRRLPGVRLPTALSVVTDLRALSECETLLLAVPMQALGSLMEAHCADLAGRTLVACCKGLDLDTLKGPSALIFAHCPKSTAAVLTGPSFAADIARGLPTALTLACADGAAGTALQHRLSTNSLRLYTTTDVIGAEFGGALKNVIAIAAGVAIGAGLGDSARAAVMTRGYAEMVRLALALGARAETLSGLSGLGDLVLTCTSAQSRNFRFGVALGSGAAFDPTLTVEGVATAAAVERLATARGIDMPIAAMVSALTQGHVGLKQAVQTLLSRPLKQE